jgi:hypothetical protein
MSIGEGEVSILFFGRKSIFQKQARVEVYDPKNY